jgi:hypothetical protein
MLYSHDRHPDYRRLARRSGEEGRAGNSAGTPRLANSKVPEGRCSGCRMWHREQVSINHYHCEETNVPAITPGGGGGGTPSHRITSHHIPIPLSLPSQPSPPLPLSFTITPPNYAGNAVVLNSPWSLVIRITPCPCIVSHLRRGAFRWMKGSAGAFLRGGSTPTAPPGGRAGAGLLA